jgi:hypothetical protein
MTAPVNNTSGSTSFSPRERGQRDRSVPAMAACRVFISFRFCEDGDNAVPQLEEALHDAGISAFVCDPQVGDNIAAAVACAVDACELFVVLGTVGYGTQGESRFSTREELDFAVSHNKPIFLIKRCDVFDDPVARRYLPDSMLHQEWLPCTRMPDGLVEDIKAKLEAAAVVRAQQMWVSRDRSLNPGSLSHELTSLCALVWCA